MIDIAQKVFAFAVTLGVLITFHELGHYVVARLAGVKVLRFSIGFGRVVWSRRIGRDATEWAVSAVPLGGYVKMVDEREGDVAPADRLHRAGLPDQEGRLQGEDVVIQAVGRPLRRLAPHSEIDDLDARGRESIG